MLTWRMLVLFIHVTAVIVALGGSLFSTFALAPILGEELAPADRLRVSRRIVRRLGTIVLGALGVLVLTGLGNLMFLGVVTLLLAIKLALVAVVIVLAVYQYGSLGTKIWRISANGPDPSLPALQQRFRKVGLTVGALVLIIVYLSLGLTRASGGIILAGIH
jgi:uncharacterized membrane protein